MSLSALLLCAGCVFGSQPQAAAPAEVISPDDAVKVVQSTYAAQAKAAAKWDVKQNDAVETSAAQQVDDANFRFAALRRAAPPAAVPLKQATAYVPHQRSYPAQFLALVETASWRRLAIFREQSAKDPWKIPFYATAPAAVPKLQVGADGFAETVPESAGPGDLAVTVSVVAPAYAAFMNDIIQRGKPASATFAPGDSTTGIAGNEASHLKELSTQGYTARDSYADAPELGTYAYRLEDGGALVFFTANDGMTITRTNAGECVGQDAGFNPWGPELKPGRYRRISQTTLRMSGSIVPGVRQASGPQSVSVFSSLGAVVAAKGELPC